MSAPADIQRTTDLRSRRATGFSSDVVGDFFNEMVKSYGFRRNRRTGVWDWSVDNIAKSYKEEPFWTAIDYLALGVPVAKWGRAARTIQKGSSAYGQAYKAGELGFGEAVRRFGTRGAPRTAVGRFISSPVTRRFDEKDFELIGKYGDEMELRGIKSAFDNELRAQRAAIERMRNDMIRKADAAGFTEEQNRAFILAMEGGEGEFDRFWRTVDRKGQEAYLSQFAFRNMIHDYAHEFGLISDNTYAKNLNKYYPRAYEEFRGAMSEGQRVARGLASPPKAKLGERHFMPRTAPDHPELTRIFDPKFGAVEMANAAQTIAQQRYGIMIARSPLAKSQDALIANFGDMDAARAAGWRRISELFPGKGARADKKLVQAERDLKRVDRTIKRHNKDWKTIEEIIGSQGKNVEKMKLSRQLKLMLGQKTGRAATRTRGQLDALTGETGRTITYERSTFKRVRKQLTKRGDALQRERDRIGARVSELKQNRRVKHMVRRMPEELRDLYLDPATADDIAGFIRIGEIGLIHKMYNATLGFFKTAHTAYNPATHSRNFLGNLIFYTMAVGFPGSSIAPFRGGPKRGFDALRGHKYQKELVETINYGILGSSFDAEVQKTLASVYGYAGPLRETWLEKMMAGHGLEKAARGMRRFRDGVHRLYAAEDEVWKLDAYISLKKRFLKNGKLTATQAAEKAALQVQRYFPNYLNVSPATELLRQGLPFASFTTEALRVWRNAMIFKPHAAVFWNNITEMMSHAMGAMANITPEEAEAGKSALPWYTQNKKMALLPWRDKDGKPHFLDLSYIIPMADLGAEVQEMSFAGIPMPVGLTAGFDPTRNPVFQILAGAVTGVDPFSERPIEPRFTEQQLGIPVDEKGARRVVGLAEHMARTMLPPIVPPAYVGVNLLELARGTKSGITGKPLEEGVARTIARELSGLRSYAPSVKAQVLNIKREQRLAAEERVNLWDRWELAVANGDFRTAEVMRQQIIEQKGAKWFYDNVGRHVPGSFMNLSSDDVREVILRSQTFRATPEEMGPIYLRMLRSGR